MFLGIKTQLSEVLASKKQIISKQAVKAGVTRKRTRNKVIDPSKLWRSKRLKENDEKLASSSFHCELCKKSFRREDLFIAHMFDVHDQIDENLSVINKKTRKVKGSRMKLSDDLFTTVIDDTGGKHYKCRLCAHVFLVLQEALDHQKQHDGTSNPMFCGLCDKHFVRRDKFVNHLETHKGATSFECNKCGKCFASLDSASKHKLNLCTAPVLYKCSLCELSFETEQLLQDHEPCVAEGQVEFRCEPCGETFSVKAVFEEHLRSHEMQITDPHICATCGIKLSSKQGYEEHVKTHDYDIYKCHCCSETYNLLEDLEMHYQMSETCLEVTCTDCQINFQSPNDLRIHLKEISAAAAAAAAAAVDGGDAGECVEDVELFVCRFCQRGFHNNDPYVAHLKVHYSDKLKRCDICSETFDNDEKLGIHYKLVHRAAKYPCIECGVIFSDKANLKKHTRESHSNENIFKCLPCGRTFYQKLEFNRHIVTKQHNKRVIEAGLADVDQPQLEGVRCPICEKVCANNRELKRHQYDHQRIQSKPKPEKLLNNNQEQTTNQDDNVSIILNSDTFYNFVDTEHVVLTTSGDQQQSPTDLLNAHLDIDSQGNIGIIYVDSSKSETAVNSTNVPPEHHILRKNDKDVDHDEDTAIEELLVVDDEVDGATTTTSNTVTSSDHHQHQNITEETFLALSEMLKQGKIDLSSLQVIQDNKEQPK